MFWQRLLTILVLLPPVIAAILLMPTEWLGYLVAAVWALGAWEWTAFMQKESRQAKTAYVFLILFGCVAVAHWAELLRMPVLLLTAAWWLLAVRWVLRYPEGFEPITAGWRGRTPWVGVFVLVPSALVLVDIHASANGPERILFLFFLVWGSDVGGYVGGRLFGKTKLAPKVSPGKTWEGVAGGVLFSGIVAAFGAYWFELGAAWPAFVMLAMAVVAMSIIGDLTQSMFKRAVKIKDSGQIFPGHGGILDRLDSTMAAAPLWWLGMLLLGLA
jgi:phosphatidate cytidylyltransferase